MGIISSILFLSLTLIFPVSHAFASVNIDINSEGNSGEYELDIEGALDGKIKINGQEFEITPDEDIDVSSDIESNSTRSSVSVNNSVSTKSSTVTESSSIDLNISHSAGPSPDPDSTIKVTVDGESLYHEEAIGEGEKVEIDYSTDEETKIEITPTPIAEQVQEKETIENESIIETIKELVNTVVTFLSNIF